MNIEIMLTHPVHLVQRRGDWTADTPVAILGDADDAPHAMHLARLYCRDPEVGYKVLNQFGAQWHRAGYWIVNIDATDGET